MTYVYPVISRRAGGVSLGINLNPNNACNWHCVYCQVPNLTRGSAPPIDLQLLENELRHFLQDLLHGDFMQRHVPENARRLEDIAFSGNGEPTSAKAFPEAVALVQQIMQEFDLSERVKLRLITNGSLLDKAPVRNAIAELGKKHGEVWFKLDAGTQSGIATINGVQLDPQGIARRLCDCSQRCSTWVQSCCFALDGLPPCETEISAWLNIIEQAAATLSGVHLYGLARPSMQAAAPRLSALPAEWLEHLAERVQQKGLTVRVSP